MGFIVGCSGCEMLLMVELVVLFFEKKFDKIDIDVYKLRYVLVLGKEVIRYINKL